MTHDSGAVRRTIAKLLLVVAPLVCVSGFVAYPFLAQKWLRDPEGVPEYAMSSYVWVVFGPLGFLATFELVGIALLVYAVRTLLRVGWSKPQRNLD